MAGWSDLHPYAALWQLLISFSATIHSVAPSPIVYPVEPVCRHRHSNDGEVPHTLVLKLTSTKDVKHGRAQDGTNLVMSEENVRPDAEVAGDEAVRVDTGVALTDTALTAAQSNNRLLEALDGAILGKMKNIYLLVDNGMAQN